MVRSRTLTRLGKLAVEFAFKGLPWRTSAFGRQNDVAAILHASVIMTGEVKGLAVDGEPVLLHLGAFAQILVAGRTVGFLNKCQMTGQWHCFVAVRK